MWGFVVFLKYMFMDIEDNFCTFYPFWTQLLTSFEKLGSSFSLLIFFCGLVQTDNFLWVWRAIYSYYNISLDVHSRWLKLTLFLDLNIVHNLDPTHTSIASHGLDLGAFIYVGARSVVKFSGDSKNWLQTNSIIPWETLGMQF